MLTEITQKKTDAYISKLSYIFSQTFDFHFECCFDSYFTDTIGVISSDLIYYYYQVFIRRFLNY